MVTIDQAKFLLDQMVEGVAVLRDMKILYCNASFANLVESQNTAQDLIDTSALDYVADEDYALVRDRHAERISGKDTANDEYQFRITTELENTRWVNAKTRIIDWNGKSAVLASFLDITESRSQLMAQTRRAAVFQSAFRLVPDWILMIEESTGNVMEANPAFVNTTGMRRDDILEQPADKMNIWADPTFFSRFFEELKSNVSMNDVPVAMRTRGNIIRHFRLYAQKILEDDASPMFLVIARDITEDLIQGQELQKSRDTAELANRAKSEFLANMSHELRTPLNAILGFAEIIRDRVFGPDQHDRYTEYAADIHDSGRHLLSIINDILDISKVEAGRLEAHLSWLNPVPALDMCVALVQQRAEESGLSLTSHIDPTIMLEADERLIKQIALNLLSNAVKFTEAGGSVSLRLEWGNNGTAVLSIEDTGIGMTPDEIRIAKRPFGQIDSSLSRKHTGSGLGLPLVSSFAQELRATMAIHSISGRGTQMSVVFPADKVRRKTVDDEEMI